MPVQIKDFVVRKVVSNRRAPIIGGLRDKVRLRFQLADASLLPLQRKLPFDVLVHDVVSLRCKPLNLLACVCVFFFQIVSRCVRQLEIRDHSLFDRHIMRRHLTDEFRACLTVNNKMVRLLL